METIKLHLYRDVSDIVAKDIQLNAKLPQVLEPEQHLPHHGNQHCAQTRNTHTSVLRGLIFSKSKFDRVQRHEEIARPDDLSRGSPIVLK